MDLVSWIGVVLQVRGHQHSQVIVICVGLVRSVQGMIPDQPLEALEGFAYQVFFELLKSPEVNTPAVRGTPDYLEPVEGLNQEELD